MSFRTTPSNTVTVPLRFAHLLPDVIVRLDKEGVIKLREEPVPNLPHLVTVDACVRRRGEEDKLYAASDELHRALPRGLCFLVDVELNKVVHVLAGLRKFTYDNRLPKDESTARVSRWVFCTKSNGECMHVAAFRDRIAGNCVFAGSKTVHGVYRIESFDLFKQDLMAYTKNRRFGYANAMLNQLVTTRFDAIVKQVVPHLVMTGRTLCLESCRTDSLHLVHYASSDAHAFALTDYSSECMWTCTNPIETRELCAAWGITSVEEVRIVDANDEVDLAAQRKYFYELPNCEGAVVYGLDTAGQVISVFKWKNFQYMAMRSLRELLKRDDCSEQKVLGRLSYPPYHALHPLGIDAHKAFLQESLDFRAWYQLEGKQQVLAAAAENAKDEADADEDADAENEADASSTWVAAREAFSLLTPVQRKSFRSRAHQRQITQDHAMAAALARERNQAANNGTQVQIVLVGPPGSSKSSIGRSLCHLWNEAHGIDASGSGAAVYLDQDMCNSRAAAYHARAKELTTAINTAAPASSQRGGRGGAQHRHAAAAAAASQKKLPELVVFGKCHGTVRIRDGLREAIRLQRLVYVVLHHSGDGEPSHQCWGNAMRDLCVERIRARGVHHLTLSDETPDMPGIIANHCASFEPLELRELMLSVRQAPVLLDVKPPASLAEQLQALVFQLASQLPSNVVEFARQIAACQRAAQASCTDESRLKLSATQVMQKHTQPNATGHARVSYWCIKLDTPSAKALYQASGLPCVGGVSLHVTLYFPGQDMIKTPEIFQARRQVLDQLVGQQVTVTAEGLARDEKGVSALVKLNDSLPYFNEAPPHVTLWTAPGIRPMYGGQLAKLAARNQVPHTTFATPLILKGHYTRL